MSYPRCSGIGSVTRLEGEVKLIVFGLLFITVLQIYKRDRDIQKCLYLRAKPSGSAWNCCRCWC
jgi:hypothetical protein